MMEGCGRSWNAMKVRKLMDCHESQEVDGMSYILLNIIELELSEFLGVVVVDGPQDYSISPSPISTLEWGLE